MRKRGSSMKILESTDRGNYFVLDKDEKEPVLEITRDNLFKMMENVYSNKDFYDMEDSSLIISEMKNPIEKEIANQIVNKIKEFQGQVDNIKARLDAQYPEV